LSDMEAEALSGLGDHSGMGVTPPDKLTQLPLL
jgi:hypothetical protein